MVSENKYSKDRSCVFVDTVNGFNMSSVLDGNVLYILVIGEPDDASAFITEVKDRNLDNADIYHVRYLPINEDVLLEHHDLYFEVSRDEIYEQCEDLIGVHKVVFTYDVNMLNEEIPYGISYFNDEGILTPLYETTLIAAET